MAQVLHQPGEIEYESWRRRARALLAADVIPASVEWLDPADVQGRLFQSENCAQELPGACAAESPSAQRLSVPSAFPKLARFVLCHRSAEKWPLLYRLVWRLTRGGEGGLLSNVLDDDVFAAGAMAKEVRRDAHKMKAFVRFCRVADGAGGEHFVAYHQPDHPILAIVAPFFARRFSVLNWTILTPFGSASWSDRMLSFGPPAARDQAPPPDSLEDFWKTYYASTFNPARSNLRAMTKEMPRKYWSTLPEAELIEELLANAPERTGAMLNRTVGPAAHGAAAFIPAVERREPDGALRVLQEAANACRGCDLYRDATCAVFGEGPADAKVMLVGEQPGDQEDRAGRPFVGPAGGVLDRALAAAGIDRRACYVTNAVKHFKWTPEPRGKRRIHAKPSYVEGRACRPWLEQELALVRPQVLVLLGATAAQSLLGAGFRIMQQRGRPLLDTAFAAAVVPTIHPSAVLRAGDGQLAEHQYDLLVGDLQIAADLVARG